MNLNQKIAIAAGAALAALRLVSPVRYTEVMGMRFAPNEKLGMFQNVDWSQTGMHLGAIAVVTAALALILKKGK